MKKYIFSAIILVLGFASAVMLRNFLPLLVSIIGIILLLVSSFIMERRKIPGNDDKKGEDVIWLIFAILGILTGTIWYVSLILGISSLIFSLKGIRERGSTLAKVSTAFSIVSIANCAVIYITFIMTAIINA